MNIVLYSWRLRDISDAYESKISLKVIWNKISLLLENKYLDVHIEVKIKTIYNIFNRPPTNGGFGYLFRGLFYFSTLQHNKAKLQL